MVGSRLSRGRHRRRALPPDAARVVPGATLGNPRLAPRCPRQRRPRSKADRARVRHQVLPDAVGSRGRAAVPQDGRPRPQASLAAHRVRRHRPAAQERGDHPPALRRGVGHAWRQVSPGCRVGSQRARVLSSARADPGVGDPGGHAHGVLLPSAAQQACPPAAARRRVQRLSGSQDHRRPLGTSADVGDRGQHGRDPLQSPRRPGGLADDGRPRSAEVPPDPPALHRHRRRREDSVGDRRSRVRRAHPDEAVSRGDARAPRGHVRRPPLHHGRDRRDPRRQRGPPLRPVQESPWPSPF